ncbi:FprA family A-type flavoprotein [Methanocella sp. CWC-04]|uniref:FprA family A-type flavoprotein n=1 Tax=Methanooceanicella nereidis TaxID=2052831 RepID=A0AAP2RER9_9EURY|nr:flavodoxin domain-containing protein [Methanocella sp. CWC-04]MCD1295205.1 FprA family A-type flavoprotein [Methanocella sp. CWC-04]
MSKFVIVYLSTSGNTKMMAEAIAEGARSRGLDADAISFYDVDVDTLKNADAVGLGCSTFWYKMHDAMERFLDKLSKEHLEGKVGVSFGSYGWSGEAPVQIATRMREMGMHVLDPVLRIMYTPNEKDLEECKRLGKDVAMELKKHKPSEMAVT